MNDNRKIHHKVISDGRKGSRRSIVFGMPWYTVDEDESPRKAGAAFSREIPLDYDLLLVRKGDGRQYTQETPQFALASTSEGAKSGAVSAAAMVAHNIQAESWIFILEINETFWICSGRDGYILPNGDRIYETRDKAEHAFNALNPSSFKKVYLPPSWKQAGTDINTITGDTEETDLSEFLDYAVPKWGRLSSVSQTGKIAKVASLLLVIGIVLTGWQIYTSQTASSGLTPEQIKAAREKIAEQRRQSRLTKYAKLDANRPWYHKPTSSDVLHKCLSAIRSMPSSPVGYEIIDISCDAGSAQASLKRTTGYAEWLREWDKNHKDVTAQISSNGDSGFLSKTMNPPRARGREDLISFSEASRKIMDFGQIDGASVDLTTPAAAVVKDEPDYTPYYATSTYKIETKRPDPWYTMFSETPGFSISQIVYNLQKQTYSIQGELYVPNLR